MNRCHKTEPSSVGTWWDSGYCTTLSNRTPHGEVGTKLDSMCFFCLYHSYFCPKIKYFLSHRCVGTRAKAEDTLTSGATSPPCCGDTARPSTCSIRPRCGAGMGQFRIQSSDSLMKNDLSRPPYCRLLFSCKGVRLDPGCTDVTYHKSGWPLLQFYPELA